MIKAGTLDAQENPFANTVTYGVHAFHRFHTLSAHFYVSRPVFVHRPTFDAWPKELQRAMEAAVGAAVAFQRRLAIEEHEAARRVMEKAGCDIVALTPGERAAFVAAVQPLLAEARRRYGEAMFRLVPQI
jgi:TRAP-type C4-dicarboxylate transport system substrate-binding protein